MKIYCPECGKQNCGFKWAYPIVLVGIGLMVGLLWVPTQTESPEEAFTYPDIIHRDPNYPCVVSHDPSYLRSDKMPRYRISWKSRTTGHTGGGTRTFLYNTANIVASDLDRIYPDIEHWVVREDVIEQKQLKEAK